MADNEDDAETGPLAAIEYSSVIRSVSSTSGNGPVTFATRRLAVGLVAWPARHDALDWASRRLPSQPMQVATFVIAMIGVVLSALSLDWQSATYFLTGGRVKVDLRVGAMNMAGWGS
jgi:hypothetical protein